jgi:hypothetical protein
MGGVAGFSLKHGALLLTPLAAAQAGRDLRSKFHANSLRW